ncbi:ComEA family DNA-binding protein [Enterococcus sp. LJL51]|uniref:ComEA family DNA-binding protein n=1 Tax=Enterococcus sp. LJL51 TaxID=3416656 RepID=UPI003CF5B171
MLRAEKINSWASILMKLLRWQVLIVILGGLLILPVRGNTEALDKVDINYAAREDLELITGIGSVISERIVQGRPYESLDELMKVKGIGTKTLEKIKAQDVAFAIKDSETKTYREWLGNDELAKAVLRIADYNLEERRKELDWEITYKELRETHSLDFYSLSSDFLGQELFDKLYLLGNVSSILLQSNDKLIEGDFSYFKNLRKLNHLTLSQFAGVGENGKNLFKYTPNLDRIDFEWANFATDVSKEFIDNMSTLNKLEYLTLFYSYFPNPDIFLKLKSLKVLDVTTSFFYLPLDKGIDIFGYLDKMPKLEAIRYANSGINTQDMLGIIDDLNIPNIHFVNDWFEEIKGNPDAYLSIR